MLTFDHVACSALPVVTDGKPPTEFRIFKAGLNETTKGPFLLDAQALAETLARFQKEGVDLQIDLEHDSLNDDARARRSDASDARGWCKLAARNGELWAVGVKWTNDGARRLTEKTQRYISPVALRDRKTQRVVGIHNLALCAVPATYGAVPLVAASRRTPSALAVALSVAVRRGKLAKESDPGAKLTVILEALGLEDNATLGAIHDAIDALLGELAGPGAINADALGDAGDAPNEAAALRRQIAALKKANAADEVAKLSKETQDAIKAKGWTPEEFIERRNKATKRF